MTTKPEPIKTCDPWSLCRRVIGVKGMLCLILSFLLGAATIKCAPIGIQTKGESGPVAWEATDLRLVQRTVEGIPAQRYGFTLVLKETQGRGITFTHAKYTITSLEADILTAERAVDWELRPHGELRRPFSYGIKPFRGVAREFRPIGVAWTILLTGKDDQNRPVRVSININLPSKPPVQQATKITHPSTAAPLTQPTIVPVSFVSNVILVSAILAGKERATLLLDTGASRTAITPDMARQLGISPTEEAPRVKIVVFGGSKIEVPVVELSSIQIGDATVKNLKVGVSVVNPDAPLVDGVLGGDFLGHFKVTVDRAASRLTLDPLSTTSPPAPAHGPLELEFAQKRAFEKYLDEHKYPHFKAFVVQVNGTSWGRSWGYNKPEEAIERAMEECRRRASDCQLYAVGQREVSGLSEEELSMVLRDYYQDNSQLADLTDIKRRALNSAQIRRLISGRKGEGVLSRSGSRGTIEFMASGRLVVRVVKSDTRSHRKDEGEWWTDADRFCRRFEKFFSGLSECFYVVEEQGGILYYDENGALVGRIGFPDEKPVTQPTTVERTAEEPVIRTQEKRLTYIPKELKDTKIPAIKLRSTPKPLVKSDIEKMIGKHNFYVRNKNEIGEFPNDFVDNDDGTITDRTTGLMWEKGGSSSAMRYWSAKRYVSRLNKERSGGYNDWRIPTTEEVASLLERDHNNRALYIAPLFDVRQKAYWTSDTVPTAHAGLIRNNVIDFSNGTIDSTNSVSTVPNFTGEEGQCFIRAVRSTK
jgi:hypothetical protein